MVNKTIYKNGKGRIHFGINAPDGYVAGTKADVEKALKKLGKNKLWRCNVCNDLHLAPELLKECPTCLTPNAYTEISLKEFTTMISI